MNDKTSKKYSDYGYMSKQDGPSHMKRPEYQYVIDWITPNSKVLDICCGEGSLGKLLIEEKNCEVYGIEIDKNGVEQCLTKGIKAKEGNADLGLEYPDKSFDYVIINVSLQMIYRPDFVLQEAIRIGKKVIVSFPNFGFWKSRFDLLFKGVFPPRPLYGYKWYNTRHIHLFSYKDFQRYAKELNIRIADRHFLGEDSARKEWAATLFPNLFSMVCILLLEPK